MRLVDKPNFSVLNQMLSVSEEILVEDRPARLVAHVRPKPPGESGVQMNNTDNLRGKRG